MKKIRPCKGGSILWLPFFLLVFAFSGREVMGDPPVEAVIEEVAAQEVVKLPESDVAAALQPKAQIWGIDKGYGLSISDKPLIDLKEPNAGIPSSGLLPVELEVRNFKNITRELTFSLSRSAKTVTLSVPPMGMVKQMVYFPLLPPGFQNPDRYYYRGYELSVNEKGVFSSNRGGSYSSSSGIEVTLGGGANFLHRDAFAAAKGKLALTLLFCQDFPADWRVYSSLDVIALEHKEYEALDQARKTVLQEWVAYGGRLLLNHYQAEKSTCSLGAHGQGRIKDISIDTSNRKSMEEFYNSLSSDDTYVRKMDFAHKQLNPDEKEFSLRLPGLTAFVILCFVILVGPVNLWVFSPVGKRQRLFWTTPLITFSCGVLLFIFIMMVDGFGGSGKRLVYVDLFPQGNSAWITQSQVSRSGILTETSFELSPDALIRSQMLNDREDWSNDEGLRQGNTASNYFSSRTSRWQDLSERRMLRGSVTLTEETPEGNPVVLSSLPGRLSNFRYMDAAGKYWMAKEILPGRKVTLEGMSNLKKELEPGNFMADGEANDLAPIETLPSIRWRDTIIYIGPVLKK